MTLTRITDQRLTERAVRKIELAFRAGSTKFDRWVGFPSDRIHAQVRWQSVYGCWFCRHDDWPEMKQPRFWLAFGISSPELQKSLSISVEINLVRDGKINRNVAGLLAAGSEGRLFLCHNGGLGGGKKGVGKAAFTRWYEGELSPIVDEEGRTTLAYPIADLNGERIVPQISEFVKACAAFKAGEVPAIASAAHGYGGAATESEKNKIIPARDHSIAGCDHAIVRNRLNTLLTRAQYRTTRDQLRDIIIGDPAKPDAELEVKSSADPQCIYAGVGQLLIHSTLAPAKRRILVLPSPVPRRHQKSLKSLGLELIEYKWTSSTLYFEGLCELFPGTESRIPIAPK